MIGRRYPPNGLSSDPIRSGGEQWAFLGPMRYPLGHPWIEVQSLWIVFPIEPGRIG
jgi:hypothetical protein